MNKEQEILANGNSKSKEMAEALKTLLGELKNLRIEISNFANHKETKLTWIASE